MLNITTSFVEGLEEIEEQIEQTEKNVIIGNEYFEDQVNFFTKAILISICTHFETFSKEIVKYIIKYYSAKLKLIEIPSNLVFWDIQKKDYKGKNKDANNNYLLFLDDEIIDSSISANPYRVRDCLEKCGIILSDYSVFNENVEMINFLVDKRNQIIHYNKCSSDLSLGDLKPYLDSVKKVIICINEAVEKRLN